MLKKTKDQKFNQSKRKHVLMITNHGCHAPKITVTIDTAGQNFYVNDYCKTLVHLGYKVTILNRGGFCHPINKNRHTGIVYYSEEWGEEIGDFCRIIYLEDENKKFIEKEKLTQEGIKQEVDDFFKKCEIINLDLKKIYYMNSHYWDSGILGLMINKEIQKKGVKKIPHVWTAHSLGILKQKNYKDEDPEVVKKLNFEQRIAYEKKVLNEVDGVVANAKVIKEVLPEYGVDIKSEFWFPPGVDTTNYHPRNKEDCLAAIRILVEETGMNQKQIIQIIENKVVFFEISRTQESKRKDVVLQAYQQLKNRDQAYLIMAINQGSSAYNQLIKLFKTGDNGDNQDIVLLDRFIKRNEGAELYALSDVFVTASQVESWGMTSHEAAASECAIIASQYVPSVYEVLKPEAAIIVSGDRPEDYTQAMDRLIQDKKLRIKLAGKAKTKVFDHYSWLSLSKNFLDQMKTQGVVE
ncbi:MAG: glycosyltransferase [Candidatus Moranbacteria bacterium]|nr:glycosyltransferase [Candidatus Moranbacteria bacterium]